MPEISLRSRGVWEPQLITRPRNHIESRVGVTGRGVVYGSAAIAGGADRRRAGRGCTPRRQGVEPRPRHSISSPRRQGSSAVIPSGCPAASRTCPPGASSGSTRARTRTGRPLLVRTATPATDGAFSFTVFPDRDARYRAIVPGTSRAHGRTSARQRPDADEGQGAARSVKARVAIIVFHPRDLRWGGAASPVGVRNRLPRVA